MSGKGQRNSALQTELLVLINCMQQDQPVKGAVPSMMLIELSSLTSDIFTYQFVSRFILQRQVYCSLKELMLALSVSLNCHSLTHQTHGWPWHGVGLWRCQCLFKPVSLLIWEPGLTV